MTTLIDKCTALARTMVSGRSRWVLHLAVTAAFIYAVNRSLDLNDIRSLRGHLRPAPLALAAAIAAATALAGALRWRILLSNNGIRCGLGHALRTVLWGATLGMITPARIGELLKGIRTDPTRKRQLAALAVADRVFSVAAIALFGLACTVAEGLPPPGLSGTLWWVFAAVNTLILGGCLYVLSGKCLPQALGGFLGSLPSSDRARRGELILASGALSIIIQVMLLAQTAFIFDMFGSPGWLRNVFVAGRAYALMAILPFSIANMGVREYSFSLFLGEGAGMSRPSLISFGASFVVLLINIVLPALVGLVWTVATRAPVRKETAVPADRTSDG